MMIYLGAKVDVEEEGMPWEGQVDVEKIFCKFDFQQV